MNGNKMNITIKIVVSKMGLKPIVLRDQPDKDFCYNNGWQEQLENDIRDIDR